MSLWALKQKIQDFQSVVSSVRTHGPSAKAASGKSILAQLREAWWLSNGPGRLEGDEYYQYCLFDDARFTAEQKREYLGRRLENDLVLLLNATFWAAIANDKLVAHMLLDHAGVPVPRPVAACHPIRLAGSIRMTRSIDELLHLLADEPDAFPVIIKPVWGIRGQHIVAVDEVDRGAGQVKMSDGKLESMADVKRRLEKAARFRSMTGYGGLLVQERIMPHKDVIERCGPRLCTLRLVVTLDDDRPRLVASLLRIPVDDNIADNYWEPGNLVAAVDPDTGVLGPAMTGLGLERRYVDEHPNTGRKLDGWALPDWPLHRESCERAARLFPGIPMQAWDIAISDRGPVAIEFNVNGGVRLPQLTAERGLYHGEFKRWLNERGFPPKAVIWPRVIPGERVGH